MVEEVSRVDGTSASPLLAVAHGSRDLRAAATVQALLRHVRSQRPELRIRAAYLDHTSPAVGPALAGLAGGGVGEVIVLPLLLTAAYHSNTDIPRALADAQTRLPHMRLHYGDTLGPDRGLTAALERRLAEAGVPAGDPDTAVVLAAAGSTSARANATVRGIAREWAHARGWWAVHPAYASAASPTPAAAVAELRRAGAPRVAVAPYFLAPGYFADKVRTASLRAGADVVASVLGAAPELATVVSARYDGVRPGSAARLAAV